MRFSAYDLALEYILPLRGPLPHHLRDARRERARRADDRDVDDLVARGLEVKRHVRGGVRALACALVDQRGEVALRADHPAVAPAKAIARAGSTAKADRVEADR